ncbi:hypothetical protein ACSMXN_06495 [Jatrophihabitans sp. DSM 45814]
MSGADPVIFAGRPSHAGVGMTRMGRLTIAAREICLDLGNSTLSGERAAHLVHRASTVRVNHCLVPPWQNTVLFLDVPTGEPTCVVFNAWQRSSLEAALRRFDFNVVIKRRILLNFAE